MKCSCLALAILTLVVPGVLIAYPAISAESSSGANTYSPYKYCATLGQGAEKIARFRDDGLAREAAIDAAVDHKPIAQSARASFNYMSGFAFDFPKYVPASVGMLAYGVCMLKNGGLMEQPAVTYLTQSVETCQTEHVSNADSIRNCIDTRIAQFIKSKTPPPALASDAGSSLEGGVLTFFKVLKDEGIIGVDQKIKQSYADYDREPSRQGLETAAGIDIAAYVFRANLSQPPNYSEASTAALIGRQEQRLQRYYDDPADRQAVMVKWLRQAKDRMFRFYK